MKHATSLLLEKRKSGSCGMEYKTKTYILYLVDVLMGDLFNRRLQE